VSSGSTDPRRVTRQPAWTESLGSHLFWAEDRASFIFSSSTGGSWGFSSRKSRVSLEVGNGRAAAQLDNKSKNRSVYVCRCPGSNSLEVAETVGWLCPCRCRALRSRLKRVDPPTPACMATLFSFLHSLPSGRYWRRVQCAARSPITTHTHGGRAQHLMP